jgi:hypothetical protein
LEMFRTQVLVPLEPVDKKTQAAKDEIDQIIDSAGLGMESIQVVELPIIHSRAGIAIYLHSLVCATCPFKANLANCDTSSWLVDHWSMIVLFSTIFTIAIKETYKVPVSTLSRHHSTFLQVLYPEMKTHKPLHYFDHSLSTNYLYFLSHSLLQCSHL